MHSASLRCSSVTCSRHAPSSRLAIRAPRRPERRTYFRTGPKVRRMYAPSFGGFVDEFDDRCPTVRGDRQFVSLLLDTLKLDRPVYQNLHAYVTGHGWPR